MTLPTPFYDALEARDPSQREAALMAALSRQVAHAKAHADGDMASEPRTYRSRWSVGYTTARR